MGFSRMYVAARLYCLPVWISRQRFARRQPAGGANAPSSAAPGGGQPLQSRRTRPARCASSSRRARDGAAFSRADQRGQWREDRQPLRKALDRSPVASKTSTHPTAVLVLHSVWTGIRAGQGVGEALAASWLPQLFAQVIHRYLRRVALDRPQVVHRWCWCESGPCRKMSHELHRWHSSGLQLDCSPTDVGEVFFKSRRAPELGTLMARTGEDDWQRDGNPEGRGSLSAPSDRGRSGRPRRMFRCGW